MNRCQVVLIISITIVILSVISGCALVGSKADRSITGFEYPEVPADYPFTPIWKRSEAERVRIPSEQLEEQELLSMVMVKLWSEGNHDFIGGVIDNDTFYPIYPDVAYVEWDEYKEPDGTIHRYVSVVLATGDSDKIMDQLNNGETPERIRIVDYQSAGIDPYKFLSE